MPLYSNPSRRVSSAKPGLAPPAVPFLMLFASCSVSRFVFLKYPSYNPKWLCSVLSEMPCNPARSNFFGAYDCWTSGANGSLLRWLFWGERVASRDPAGSRFRRAANKLIVRDLAYLTRLHREPSPLLLELEQHGLREGIPIVDRAAGRFLSVLVHCMQANRVLELGTAYGYSTLWMALALPPAGRLGGRGGSRSSTSPRSRCSARSRNAISTSSSSTRSRPSTKNTSTSSCRCSNAPGSSSWTTCCGPGAPPPFPRQGRTRRQKRSASSTRRSSTIRGSTRPSCRSATGSASVPASTDDFREAMRRFATGVAIVTTSHEGRIHGFTANAFASVSADPPTVLICVNRRATAHPLISSSQRFCVNVLALDQRALAERFAGGEPRSRFDGVEYRIGPSGSPILAGTLAHLDCTL